MERITDRDIAEKIAELFKGFCDPTRVRILSLLAERDVKETFLWQEYMVYAALLGVAKQVMEQLRRLYLRMDGLHRGGDESEAEPLAALADILEEKKEAWQRGNGQ